MSIVSIVIKDTKTCMFIILISLNNIYCNDINACKFNFSVYLQIICSAYTRLNISIKIHLNNN